MAVLWSGDYLMTGIAIAQRAVIAQSHDWRTVTVGTEPSLFGFSSGAHGTMNNTAFKTTTINQIDFAIGVAPNAFLAVVLATPGLPANFFDRIECQTAAGFKVYRTADIASLSSGAFGTFYNWGAFISNSSNNWLAGDVGLIKRVRLI
jgi:hypothetical protein